MIYLDFRKAFDSIPHPELLYKLWILGITGPLWFWFRFRSYLNGHSHLVNIEGSSSDLLPVRSGVPQGSVLGPLLFLVYINDLPSVINSCSTYLFADDSKLLGSSTFMFHIQQDLDNLVSWCHKWRLSLNTTKCAVVRFTISSQSKACYYIEDNLVPSVDSHKDLGILVAADLSWSKHINFICANAYKTLHLIRRSVSSTSLGLRKSLYLSLVRSKLSYCSQLWRPHLVKDILCLESVQRRATRYILNDYSRHTSYKSRLINIKLLPLMYWLELQDVLFLVKCLQGTTDNFNIHDFIPAPSSSHRPTRASQSGKFKHKLCRTVAGHQFYLNRIIRLWNALPQIDLSLSFQSVKHFIFEFLWNHFITHFQSDISCTYHFMCPCSSCSSLPH